MMKFIKQKPIIFLNNREVFKAREKKSNKKFVAMKKVLMDNEKEGVRMKALDFS